jgi:protocatechuate 3,4-dioxygenase beta subunit
MRLRLLAVASLFALIAAITTAALHPVGLGTVGGQVLDAQGTPVAAALVTLQASDGGQLQTTQTNTDGRFWFASLPEGQYPVRVSDHGLVSEWRQNVWVAPGRQTDVTLHLRPARKNLTPFR